MNISEYFLKNKVISWLLVVLLLVGGSFSFTKLGQLEFPEFPIPQAMVITFYPGASPEQVEEEVTVPIERAIKQLEYVKHIDSVSSAGVSQITVELLDSATPAMHPQIWDELRRKVYDLQAQLPPGVNTPMVNDDFSDVFGILYNISGEGYSYRDLENYGDFLRRELSLVKGVSKVSLAGVISQQVIVEISQEKLKSLNLNPSWIYSLIQHQNVVSNAGSMLVDGQSIRIHPTGEFKDIRELEELIISPAGSTQLTRLGDIARAYKDFEKTPDNLYHSNGDRALSLGISFSKGVNVVDVGHAVNIRLAELENNRPLGMELTTVYNQSATVDESVFSFLINLVESVAIVIVVLLLTMGARSGLLMGGILLLTIFGTFIGMYVLDVQLQLISLGALIIALGMLVDNAIVITEGVLIGLQRGNSKRDAIKQVIAHNQWPLFGATVIAIMAFAPIGLSQDTTGYFLVSLFQVLLLSLMISWFLAITLTPFFCDLFFDDPKDALVGSEVDPYKGVLFVIYRKILEAALKHRLTTVGLTIVALALAIAGFGQIKQAFFPPSNTPIFFVDLRVQEGTDIRQTENKVSEIEKQVLALDGVVNVTSVVGMGAQRFILTYSPEKAYKSYAQLIIEAKDLETIEKLAPEISSLLDTHPEVEYLTKLLQVGPAPIANIEVRFYGPDPDVLRRLGAEATVIIENEPSATGVRHSWREKVNIVRPTLDEAAARRSGISKQSLDEALLVNFDGKAVGTYREGSHLMPVVARAPARERLNADSIVDLQVWSTERNGFVPVSQAVSGFNNEVENPLIVRRDLKRVLTVFADAIPMTGDTPEAVRQRLIDKIEAMRLPDGYAMEWGGEYEMSSNAQNSLFASLPSGFLTMFLITVFLFGTIRQSLSIWFTLPLGIIGVVLGLLLFNMPFTFTALLGVLSLSGMIVKNGIVLVEQINIDASRDIPIQQAIIEACISRVRPVCMAALTTMLGMIPLIFDAFFGSMATAIVFGLGFASVLTLLVLPVAYALLYRIRFDTEAAHS
ncbi:efflux RND transporter permease subunit [Spongorhabdus nitratireducens]